MGTAGHQLDQAGGGRVGSFQCGDRFARAEHGDPVGDLGDLVHPVRDEQDGLPGGGQLAELGEQPVSGRHIERGGGLVQDQDLRVAQQRPANRQRLALRQGQRAGQGGEVEAGAEQVFQYLRGLVAPLVLSDRGAAQQAVLAEPEVVQDGLGGDALDFLEHGGDAGADRRLRVAGLEPGLAQMQLARVRAVHAGEDLDQG